VVKEHVQRVASAAGARDKEGVVAAMDYDTELGHDGVSQLDDDRRSVSDRSSESTVSNDNVLWNGEEMKEVESHDPVKRERVDDIATARKQISHGGDVEVRRHKATTMHGNSSGSLKKVKQSDILID